MNWFVAIILIIVLYPHHFWFPQSLAVGWFVHSPHGLVNEVVEFMVSCSLVSMTELKSNAVLCFAVSDSFKLSNSLPDCLVHAIDIPFVFLQVQGCQHFAKILDCFVR